ncbi:hypothetical protein B0186_06540 [Canicola haemoglobinophilus]|uniref:Uncharacterized protein n=1 Tax=Canicola haemoglobinophilus TaxID=733 RepID=A0A1V4B0J5_9PAST|nr:hypothetical protein [Canicola haemoglobinophilus]OOS00019.1 hypothetical protein B0186_06540 [Canicola haemoglobinophilus]STO60892.1 Uncharacterised protein [Canicola haemoglobinophilus]
MSNTNYNQVSQENTFKPDLEGIKATISTAYNLLDSLADKKPIIVVNEQGHELEMTQDDILDVVMVQLLNACDDIDEIQTALFNLVNGVVGGGYEDDTVH